MEKIKDTKLGVWLRDKAPDVLDAVGDAIPESGVLGIVKNLLGNRGEGDAELNSAMMEIEMKRIEAVSRRWEADMKSDSTLSKNVRPIALISLLVMFFSFAVVDSIGSVDFTLSPEYIDTLKVLSMTAFGAYFAGRSYEKIRR